MPYLLGLHLLAAVIWVGGMFLAYTAVRPAAGSLEPAVRLGLWRRIGARFFPVVGVACVVLLGTGYAMIFEGFGGFAGAGLHIHIMQGTGLLMVALFAHLVAAPYRRLRRSLDADDIPSAGKALGQIRRIVHINLWLGLITVVIGGTGRYWG